MMVWPVVQYIILLMMMMDVFVFVTVNPSLANSVLMTGSIFYPTAAGSLLPQVNRRAAPVLNLIIKKLHESA